MVTLFFALNSSVQRD